MSPPHEPSTRSRWPPLVGRGLGRIYLLAEEGLALVGAGLIVAMMLLTALDVGLRQFRGSPLIGAFELMEFMMAGVVFLGLAHVQRMKGHIAIEFVTSRFDPRVQRLLRVLGYLLGLIVFGAITWETGQQAYAAWSLGHRTTGGARLPTWPGRITVPLGTGMLCIRLTIDAVAETRAHLTRRRVTERPGIDSRIPFEGV